MIGTIRVSLIIHKNEDSRYDEFDEIKVEASCDYVHESMSGYGGHACDTYYEGFEEFEIDEEEIKSYVQETYGNVDYEFYVDEDSFVEYDCE